MSNLLRKKHIKRLTYSKPVLVLLAVLLVLVGRATWNVYEKERHTQEKLLAAAEELAELQVRESELEENVASLGTQEGIEQELRDMYGVAREDEHVIVIVEEDNAELHTEEENTDSWLGRLWKKIF